MLGAGLVDRLALQHAVHATVREESDVAASRRVVIHTWIDVLDEPKLAAIMATTRPDIVVNAVGVVKQLAELVTIDAFNSVNALFPHRLAHLAAEHGAHLIHISTDCVFSGRKGQYVETDLPDPDDIYGMSKMRGEPKASNVTVLRCSLVGLEQKRPGKRTHGLIEWFLSQSETAPGFARAIFSGLTVRELSRLIEDIGMRGGLAGIWHVGSQPISKLDLLRRLADRLPARGIRVEEVEGPAIDRSLDSSAFRRACGYDAPSWDDMLDELASDIRQREDRPR
jgi:dTDP-4-dehydrorhamnose reductase